MEGMGELKDERGKRRTEEEVRRGRKVSSSSTPQFAPSSVTPKSDLGAIQAQNESVCREYSLERAKMQGQRYRAEEERREPWAEGEEKARSSA